MAQLQNLREDEHNKQEILAQEETVQEQQTTTVHEPREANTNEVLERINERKHTLVINADPILDENEASFELKMKLIKQSKLTKLVLKLLISMINNCVIYKQY